MSYLIRLVYIHLVSIYYSLYETNFKELTEKYFKDIAWPSPAAIADECRSDQLFLVYYKEMTLRHLFSKLKPQLSDYIDAWNVYKSVSYIYTL